MGLTSPVVLSKPTREDCPKVGVVKILLKKMSVAQGAPQNGSNYQLQVLNITSFAVPVAPLILSHSHLEISNSCHESDLEKYIYCIYIYSTCVSAYYLKR